MKKILMLLAAVVFVSAFRSAPARQPKLSTFSVHLMAAAEAKGVSVGEMAREVRSWGITGVDLWLGNDEKVVDEILAAGLEPAAVIAFAEFDDGPSTNVCDAAIAYAKRVGCKRIMIVPGFVNDGETREEVWSKMLANLRNFVRVASAAGIDVVLEDFDHEKGLIGSAEHLRKTFEAIPEVGIAFDTGNFAFWKDDPVAALKEFLPRVRHVHVKDRDPVVPENSTVTGKGTVPIREIYDILRKNGYDGWFTIECFNVKDTYSTVRESAKWFFGK